MTVTALVLGLLILIALALSGWRLRDHRADRQAMRELEETQPAQPPVFTPEMIAGLPVAGNHFGTDEYFPFFVADVTAVEFPCA